MKIAVIGAGYVGMANALLLARVHEVVILEVNAQIVDEVNHGRLGQRMGSEFEEALMEAKKAGRLRATLDANDALANARWAIVAVPTDFDEKLGRFDLSKVEQALAQAQRVAPGICVAIRSTMPMGETKLLAARFESLRIIYAAEFLREGQALADVAAPSRIVVGPKGKLAEAFVELLRSCAVSSKSPVALMGSSEAEACKLYSNAYLAMRVAFFNELDSGCMALGLDARQVVQGVCMDPRIGQHYNNPSFGYGGYCLPKDTRQLAADCSEPVLPLLAAIVASNTRRIEFIAGEVVAKAPKIVGAYLLAMKAGSGNARSASAIEVSKRLIAKGIDLWVHDPSLSQAEVSLLVPGARLVESLSDFLSGVDLVMANRDSKDLASARSKVFTRDLFGLD